MNDELVLKLLGREKELISNDYKKYFSSISKKVRDSRILVIGGAGSIGSRVVYELCKFNPKLIHVVDINENNLVELVRNIRSSLGYIKGEFETYALDMASNEFQNLVKFHKGYDVWMNFAALKHVRSEKDPFTLTRLLEVNIENTYKTINLAKNTGAKKYFAVSTDKAANPINFMGASKRSMELILGCYAKFLNVSSARFGNVAFSEGSLLDGMIKRFQKRQPLVVPKDIKRYFITSKEAAKLSILSAFQANSGEVYVPLINDNKVKSGFQIIMEHYLEQKGFKVHYCKSEKEARTYISSKLDNKKWPCFAFNTDTSGEKTEEIFIAENEKIINTKLKDIQVIYIKDIKNKNEVEDFIRSIREIKKNNNYALKSIKNILDSFLDNFEHKDTGKNLNSKM